MRTAREVLLVLLLVLLLTAVLLPSMPSVRPFPGRDSGVFLYAGWRVLAGDVPYRDFWDHKPPAIFFVNALGLMIARGSQWGVWVLQFAALSIAALLGYALLRRALGPAEAVFGSAIWLLTLVSVLEWGNLTEEYALPCQFLALYASYDAQKKGRYSWQGYAIGISGALAFLLRPNLVGIWVAIVIHLLVDERRERWGTRFRALLTIFVAALGGLALVAAYFALRGGLPALLDCVFRFNMVYIGADPSAGQVDHSGAAVAGLYNLSSTGMSIVALAGWLTLLSRKLTIEQGERFPGEAWFDTLIWALPIELLFVATSGRRYPHYYMAWLPVCSILATYFVAGMAAGLPLKAPTVGNVSLLCLGLAAALLPAEHLRASLGELTQYYAAPQVVSYIERATKPDDYVLIWGAEAGVNFVTHRRSPTRFVYQYPLFTRGYETPSMVQEFLSDLQRHPPTLIVDTSPTNSEVPSLAVAGSGNSGQRAESLPPEMGAVFSYIAARYEPVPGEETGGGPWPVYRLKGTRP